MSFEQDLGLYKCVHSNAILGIWIITGARKKSTSKGVDSGGQEYEIRSSQHEI